MTNTEMTFGMEGPTVTGWWVNPKTGDKFNAVDTFFEDNQLLIKTADGRILNFNQIQNYVQSKPEDVEKIAAAAKSTKKSSKTEDIPAEVLSELVDEPVEEVMIPDDNIFGVGGQKTLGNMNANGMPAPVAETSEMSIVQRALKNKPFPEVSGKIFWDPIPTKEWEMLHSMLDVPVDVIVDYYTSKIDVNTVVDQLKKDIRECIEKFFDWKEEIGESESTESTTQKIEPKKTTRKTNKKK